MRLKKIFWIIIVIFLLAIIGWRTVFLYNEAKLKSAVEFEQVEATIKAIVKINFADKQFEYPVTVTQSATILTALQAIKDLPIKVQDYGNLGKLVTSIGDQNNGQDGKYWQYWLNGAYAQIGADQQVIKNNDVIEWKFTNEQK
jgi:hypothetical protein